MLLLLEREDLRECLESYVLAFCPANDVVEPYAEFGLRGLSWCIGIRDDDLEWSQAVRRRICWKGKLVLPERR